MLYLNMGSTAETPNKIIGNVNGLDVILFGHVEERHGQRLNVLNEAAYEEVLSFDKLKEICMDVFRNNFKELTRDLDVPKAIRGDIKIKLKGIEAWAEIAIEVRATVVDWSLGITDENGEDVFFSKEVAKDYVDYVKEGKLKIGDRVLTIETIALSVKGKNEKNEKVSFTRFDTIHELKFKQRFVNVTVPQFKEMFKNWTVTREVYNKYFKLVNMMN